MTFPIDQWNALIDGSAVIEEARDVISATGPDTAKFLHGQMSQHIENLAIDEVSWSLHLQPNGRLIGFSRVVRVDEDTFRLDTEAGVGQIVHDALKRFLIRTKCTLTIETDVPIHRFVGTVVPDQAAVSRSPWPGLDVFGSLVESAQRTVVDAAVAEAWRVAHGEPSHSKDFSENTLPSDTGIVSYAVTFGKGCYVGQELVERIDSRGRTVKSLVRLSGSDLRVGMELANEEGATVGSVTSVAAGPVGVLGIGLLKADAGELVFVDDQPVRVHRPLVAEPV